MFLLMASAFAADSVIVKAGYWLRTQPCTDSSHGACPEGVRVTREARPAEVIYRSNDWALVRIDGRRHWVYSQALEVRHDDSPQTDAPASGGQTGQIYTAIHDNSAIRNKPGTNTPGSQIVGSVDRDTPLEVVDTVRDSEGDLWYKVHFRVGGTLREAYIFEGRVRPDDDGATEASACPDGNCAGTGNINVAQVREVGQVTANDGRGFRLPRAFDVRCSTFISSEGLGTWGQKMVSAAQRVAPRCFYESHVFDSLCPGYLRMNQEQKNSFIALVFAGIAQTESNCNPRARARGSNDIADGMFQLEYSASFRRRAGRNQRWCRTGTPTNTQAVEFQSECAVSTIEDTICSNGRSLNSSGGYWQKLRGDRTISRNIRNTAASWGLCR